MGTEISYNKIKSVEILIEEQNSLGLFEVGKDDVESLILEEDNTVIVARKNNGNTYLINCPMMIHTFPDEEE